MAERGDDNPRVHRRETPLLSYARGEGGWGRAVVFACALLLVYCVLQYGFIANWWWTTVQRNWHIPQNRMFALYVAAYVPIGWATCVAAVLALCQFRIARYLLPAALIAGFLVSAGYDYFAYLPSYLRHLPTAMDSRAAAAGYVSRMLANQADNLIAGLAMIWMIGRPEFWWPDRYGDQQYLWQRLVRWASIYLWIVPVWKCANQILQIIDDPNWHYYPLATYWATLIVAGLLLRTSWRRRNLVVTTLIAAAFLIWLALEIWTTLYMPGPAAGKAIILAITPARLLASPAGYTWWLLMQRELRSQRGD